MDLVAESSKVLLFQLLKFYLGSIMLLLLIWMMMVDKVYINRSTSYLQTILVNAKDKSNRILRAKFTGCISLDWIVVAKMRN